MLIMRVPEKQFAIRKLGKGLQQGGKSLSAESRIEAKFVFRRNGNRRPRCRRDVSITSSELMTINHFKLI